METKLKEITLSPVVEKAETIEITNSSDMSDATILLSELNRELDRITKDREKLTKPLNETLKEIRGRYKPHETRLENAIAIIRKLMSTYQTEQKRIAQEKETKIAARIGEGKGHLKMETAIEKIESLEKPETTVLTESGSVKFRTVKKFELVDITKVPSEYLLLNESFVRIAMKGGKELPGIRYFTEEEPWNMR